MNKKLLLSAPILTISSLATVSCVNPFKDHEMIAKARVHDTKNNILNGKNFEEFKKNFIAKNIYSNEAERNNVLSVFEKAFKNLNDVKYLSLTNLLHSFKINKLELNNEYTDKEQNSIKQADIKLEAQVAFLEYILGKTPFAYSQLNKSTETQRKSSVKNKTINLFIDKNPIDNKISNIVNIPQLISKMVEHQDFIKNPTVENAQKAYQHTVETLSKFIYKINDVEQRQYLDVYAPIYYVLNSPSPKKYVNANYAVSEEDRFALVTSERQNELEPNLAVRASEFAADPEAWYTKNSSLINPIFDKDFKGDKAKPASGTFYGSLERYQKGISSFGFAQLVAFAMYLTNPTDIQLLAFNKTTDNSKHYFVQFTNGENKVLFNPVADFKKDTVTKYTTKDELTKAGYTLDNDLLGSSYQNSPWK